MMTRREQQAKQEITRILMKEGYVTYSRLFDLFDLNLTSDPDVVGYMEPSKARIVVNENLSIEQVSFVIRHEILHEYLDHQLRMQKHMGDDKYNSRDSTIHKMINMAADWEISNRGYTDKDKKTAKNIQLGDKVVQGLVTDIDHPEWVDLSMEEMFDKLNDEYEKDKEAFEKLLQSLKDAGLDIGEGAGSAQQQMEDVARQAQAAAEQAEQNGDKESQEQGQEIAQAAASAADDAEDQEKKANGQVLKSSEEQKEDKELADRINNIKKAFNKYAEASSIEAERDKRDADEETAKAAKDMAKYSKDPLQKFKLSLNQFIRKEIGVGRGDTWTRFNKTYNNTGLIKPGSSRLRQNKIPLINVYFDRSGSWDDAKTKDGEKAMAFLNEYVRKNQIKVNLYYFSENVHENRKKAEEEGSTRGQPILDHINKTKPDNVIVMTDSDISDCRTDVTVPGAVYFLFKDGESDNLMAHLHGKKLTRKFDI